MGTSTAAGRMTSKEIVALSRAHTFFSWSVQGAIDPIAIDRAEGDVFVANGESRYLLPGGHAERTAYSNIYVCRFDSEGRCTEFREWFMERPVPKPAEAAPA